ncbi:MAG: putative bifunctional diguanylate cyclase/phosphodiesterase [Microthrixaceae bacterium]
MVRTAPLLDRTRVRWLLNAVGVAVVGINLVEVTGRSPLGSDVVAGVDPHSNLLALATVAVGVAVARRSSGASRRAWTLLAAATGLFVAGDLVWTYLKLTGSEVPWVSPADVLYLAGYPLVFLALWEIAKGRAGREGRAALLDGLTVALGFGLLAWQAVVVAPGGLANAENLLAEVLLVAYPFLDVVLLGALVGLLLLPAEGRRALGWLAGFVGAFAVADLVYAGWSYNAGAVAWTDVGYSVAYLLLVNAMLSPAATRIAERRTLREAGTARYVLLGISALAPSITAAVCLAWFGEVNDVVFLITTAGLGAVLTVRVARTVASERSARRASDDARTELDRMAHQDTLTGLPNRPALLERLRSGEPVGAVLFVDLDRFKLVNDTAGHAFGDEVLRETARRIAAAVREDEVVHRLGGDEFVVLSPEHDPDRLHRTAERIVAAVSEPVLSAGFEWYLGASVGIAPSGPADGQGHENLLRDADLAMYAAKRRRRGSIVTFDEPMRVELEERHRTEIELRRAVAAEEIVPWFQPIVRLEDGSIAGFEALARWERSDGSVTAAGDFVEVAEQCGLMAAIDGGVLDRSVDFIARWNAASDGPDGFVSVNLSPNEVAAGDVAGRVQRALDRAGIEPSWVVVELTEGALALAPEVASRRIAELADLGVRIALDDFGTGHSSLAHLLRFPVELLKVDRLFVEELGTATAERSVAAAAHRMAATLGITPVAEGVETSGQAAELYALGYRFAQGYHFGRAMAPSQALRLATAPPSVRTMGPARD